MTLELLHLWRQS